MNRLPHAAFAALVAATVAAFFVTQHLKVTAPVITGVSHPARLTPGRAGCRGVRNQVAISFYLLHRADVVTVYIVDHNGEIVRRLVANVHMVKPAPGNHARRHFDWNGRKADGSLARNGTYYFRVVLRQQRRTVDLTGYPVILASHEAGRCIT